MEYSELPSALVFIVGNYFVAFFIIGLIAAGISLLNKPKPLRIAEVSEALLSYHLLFAIGINNLINFVFHVLFGDVSAKFIGWENSPFQAEVGFASLGVGNRRSPCVQGKFAVSLRDTDSTLVLFIGGSWRSHLPNDRGAQFLAGKRGISSPDRYTNAHCRLRVFVALVQTSPARDRLSETPIDYKTTDHESKIL